MTTYCRACNGSGSLPALPQGRVMGHRWRTCFMCNGYGSRELAELVRAAQGKESRDDVRL